jgi:hypothetical protein
MTVIADIRAVVRKDLHDEDAAAYLWTDAVLDRHITHAVADYSVWCPLEQKTTLTTTAGSRDLSISSLTGLIDVERVEWPVGEFPPHYQGFAVWGTTLTLDNASAPAGVENVNVFWTKEHLIDGSGSDVPVAHEDLIAVGAVAYAAHDRETFTINKINVGGEVWGRYKALADERMATFVKELKRIGRNNTVRSRRLYSTDAPAVFEQGRVKY